MRAHLKRVDSEFARGWESVKGREVADAGSRPVRKQPRRAAARAQR
jgi:hypothetical protein